MLERIIKALRETGNLACLRKADSLETDTSATTLNLRSLGLATADIASIANVLSQEGEPVHSIESISFSYNTLIGDTGAALIARSLPSSIREIGLVGCGIGDEGGAEILNWMKTAQHLQRPSNPFSLYGFTP